MRSTVSDSSGNPENGETSENGENPEYGEERYGALPVREWAVPDRPGRDADASAHADAPPGPDGPGPDAVSGRPYDWSASGPGSGSVVDLVLDLMPGEGERGGSAFGATSASVSVPGAAREPAVGAATDADVREEVREDVREEAREDVGEDVRDLEPLEPLKPLEPLELLGHPGQPALAGPPFLPGPELSPARRDAAPSLSLSFGGADTGADTGELRSEVRVDTGRHHSVIANERTASIPVHLLFRDDPEVAADAAALPATVVRRAAGIERTAGVRRPPVPRSPQVRPSTRPSPVADPRLNERPGPALPGWAALLAGLGGLAASGGVLWWTGALPGGVPARLGLGPRPYGGIGLGAWAALALLLTTVLFALGGLTRGRVGYAWVLTLFGQYRGSVRRTGLMWVSPLLLRRRVDVRLRHWRSEPLPAVDANGTALRVVVLVVWRVKDTVRATLGIADHEEYLREQVEAAMARVLSQLPADAFHEDAHTLRNAEAVGDALTRMLKADCEPVGVEVYSAQPTGIEYAPEVAAAMQRRRIAAIDAKHRDSVLTSVVDAVDDTVNRLTARGLVELDDYERKSLVKDLTVAFYTGRGGGDSV